MSACTFRSKRKYYWMKSEAVWDKRRGDEEVSRAICGSPTGEKKGWDGEREKPFPWACKHCESESLAEGGVRGGKRWNGGGEGW